MTPLLPTSHPSKPHPTISFPSATIAQPRRHQPVSAHLSITRRKSILLHGALLLPALTARADGTTPQTCPDLKPTKTLYMDVSIDSQDAGRILIGIYTDDVPVGAGRFADLVEAKTGLGYRNKEFIKITPTFIQHAGVRSFGADTDIAGGRNPAASGREALLREADALAARCAGGVRFRRGDVGIIVKDPSKPPDEVKLVARDGRLVVRQEERKPDPNATQFVIATNDASQLGSSALLIGRVLRGLDVVDRISSVKVVQDNTGSPYFRFVFCPLLFY
eukprot:TRINITY_DN120_c0_g1_i1.p1 TRINITY_DN120_c0_g1~~TRINITY_DN120_c0_g1_i1.p1  ORF type:complete len:277 (+),score=-20.10 TRINITY_DN120_c0_g1_i1:109-939(+)